MQPSSQIPSNPDLHGVVELARMQIAMQRELTALRTQKLVLTQKQMTGADRQSATHLSVELREARTQISALRQDVVRLQQVLEQARKTAEADKARMTGEVVRLQQALDQAQGSLTHVRKVAKTNKVKMARNVAKHRARCENLRGVVDEIKHSWSWRIGQGIVRMARFLLWPVARLKGAPRSRTLA